MKITITIEDRDSDNADVKLVFDPPLTKGTPETPAFILADAALSAMKNPGTSSDEVLIEGDGQ